MQKKQKKRDIFPHGNDKFVSFRKFFKVKKELIVNFTIAEKIKNSQNSNHASSKMQ